MPVAGYHTRYVTGRRISTLSWHLAGLIPENMELLDVGCGDGKLACEILRLRPDLGIAGVDVLLREGTAIPVSHFDGVRLPQGDKSVDAVMFVDVLHHTLDPMILLREAARVSRRWIVIKDHLLEGFAAQSTLTLMDWVGNARFGVALPYNYWQLSQWNQGFAQLGLRRAAELTRLDLYPWWADWIFGRQLHFIALLEVPRDRQG